MSPLYKKLLLIATNLYTLNSHTWIDKLICEDTNESGFIRNYNSRMAISDFDIYMTYVMEGRNPQMNVCSPNQQDVVYNDGFPMLRCPAGSRVSFVYNTNGHVITDQCIEGDPRGCKDDGHTVDSFWSIHSNADIKPDNLQIIGDVYTNPQFNDDSSLTNLIVKDQPYNFNGVCEALSSEPCIGEFTIPEDIGPNGVYQFVWSHRC